MKQLIFLSFIFLALGGTVGRPAPHSRASSSHLPDDRNDFMDEDWFKAGLVDDQGDGLCAVTAVDGSFKEFVPSFVFSLHRSHPRSKAIVLVADSLPSRIDQVLAQNGVPRHSYRIVVHSALRNTPESVGLCVIRSRRGWPPRDFSQSMPSLVTAAAGCTTRTSI